VGLLLFVLCCLVWLPAPKPTSPQACQQLQLTQQQQQPCLPPCVPSYHPQLPPLLLLHPLSS
jgi:hypothetical protein